jgi:hypothetical protein
MSGSAIPSFPSTGGMQVLPSGNAAPPPFPAEQSGAGPAPPPFPSSGGMQVSQSAAQSDAPAPGISGPSGTNTIGRNLATGFAQGAAGLVDIPVEVAKGIIAPGPPKVGQPIAMLGRGAMRLATQQDADDWRPTPGDKAWSAASQALQPVARAIAGSKAFQYANVTPKTPADYIEQGIGSMAPWAIQAAAAPETEAGSAPGVIDRMAAAAKLLGVGATSGAGQYAGQAIGNAIAPGKGGQIGADIGSLAGGFGAVGAGAGAAKLVDALSDVAPITPGMKLAQAKRTIQAMAPDLGQARTTIQSRLQPGAEIATSNGPVPLGQNGEILRGAAPTAAQLAGSPSLARIEEGLKAAGNGVDLQKVTDTQSAKAAAAVGALGPEEGAPSSLGGYFRQAQQNQDMAFANQEAATTQARDTAVQAQPGLGGATSPYQVGQDLQGSIGAADQAKKIATDSLYGALRDKNPVMNMAPLAGTARDIWGEAGARQAGDVSAQENSLLGRAAALGENNNTTWSQVEQLRQEVGDAIDGSLGQYGRPTNSTRRLQMLKSGIDDASQSAIDKLPQQNEDWGNVLSQQANLWTQAESDSERQSALQYGQGPGNPGSGSPGGVVAQGQAGQLPAISGAMGAEQRALSDTTGNSRAQAPGVQPLDQETADLARAARASHAARMATFQNPMLGPLIKKSYGQFDLAPESVVQQAVPSGPRGAAIARAVNAASQNDPDILDHYQTAVGLSLRRAAMKDGVVNRKALDTWTRGHQALLGEMPDVAARIAAVDRAQQFVDEAHANRAEAAATFKEKAIDSLLNGGDPSVAMASLLSGDVNSANLFMRMASREPGGEAAAKKAMADHLAEKLLKPAPGGEQDSANIRSIRSLISNPAKLQNLRVVLGDQAPAMLRKVLQQYDIFNTGAMSKLSEDGSRTTPLSKVAQQIGAPKTILGKIIQEALEPVADTVAVGMAHPMAAIPAYLASSGLKGWISGSRGKAADILGRIMADPKLFLEATKPVAPGARAVRFTRDFVGTLQSSMARVEGSSQ